MHDHKWTGLATTPVEYAEEWGTTRIVKPPTYAATFNMIACAAQAARLWKGIDDSFADKCLKNAEASWKAVMAKESKWAIQKGNWETDPQFAPLDQAIGGGGYGDTYVEDDAYWAACELFSTTGKDDYYSFLSKYKNKNDGDGHDKAFDITCSLGGGENNGSFSSFNWGCTSGLGTLSLYLNPSKLSSAEQSAVKSSITAAGDAYLTQMAKEGMGIPYKEATFEDAINIGAGVKVTGYEWGSNSFVINNAMVLAYAYDASKSSKYLNGAAEALDYIFGRNGLGFSFVTGYGTYHSENPHHRYWSYELDHSFPMAPSGVMSGGCGAGLQDPYVGGLGYQRGKVASQKCFVDSIEAWSVNEVTINWNAPFAWAMSFFDDEAKGFSGTSETTTTTNVTTTTTTTSTTPVKDPVWGDTNCDGVVELADAILIMQTLASPNKYTVTDQGRLNGDVDKSTVGLTSNDALFIQEYLLHLRQSLVPAT
jgi:endoglucanase